METSELRYIVVSKDKKETFPLTMVQIASRVRRGIIKPNTMLSSTDGAQIYRAGDIPDLAVIFEQKGVPNVFPTPASPAVNTPRAGAPIVVDPSKATTFYVEEASRQYKSLNWCLILGILFIPLLFGVFMVIHACVQKPALRRRVAELGVDPVAWALPLDGDLQQNVRIAGFVVLCGVAAVVTFSLLRSVENEGRNTHGRINRIFR